MTVILSAKFVYRDNLKNYHLFFKLFIIYKDFQDTYPYNVRTKDLAEPYS